MRLYLSKEEAEIAIRLLTDEILKNYVSDINTSRHERLLCRIIDCLYKQKSGYNIKEKQHDKDWRKTDRRDF